MRTVCQILLSAVLTAGCAAPSTELVETPVAAIAFEGKSCEALLSELGNTNRRIADLIKKIDAKSANDKSAVILGITFFTPLMLAVQGNGNDAKDFSALLGSRKAMLSVANGNRCASPGLNASRTQNVGDTYEYIDYDAIGGGVQGKSSMRLSQISGSTFTFDNGSFTTTPASGWRSSGKGLQLEADLRGSSQPTQYKRSMNSPDGSGHAEMNLTHEASDMYATSDGIFQVETFNVTGYARGPSHTLVATNAILVAPVQGKITVERETGIPIFIKLNSRVTPFNIHKVLIGKVGTGQ